MTRFNLQQHLIKGFDMLLNFDDDQLRKVISILQAAPVGFGFEWLKSRLIEISNSEDDAEVLSRTIYGFGGLINYNGSESLHDLVDGLSRSYYEKKGPEDVTAGLSDRILDIISNAPALSKTNKVISLLSDKQHVYRDSKILSDVRLLFEEDIEDGSHNAVIIHDLKIDYQSKANSQEAIFISLDIKDLKTLKSNIERALNKDSMIRKQNKNINFIDILD